MFINCLSGVGSLKQAVMKLSTVIASLVLITQCRALPLDVGLYHPEDGVHILTVDNFKATVENSPKAWLVEFYASWCGDCQRFAPFWKAFAKDVKAWHDLIGIAVIGCAEERNTPICWEYGIETFPSVKYFPENYKTTPQNLGIAFNKTENKFNKHLIDLLVKEQKQGRGQHYPNLLPQPLSSPQFDNEDIMYIFSVGIDESNYYPAVEVALDLHRTPNVTLRYYFENTPLVNVWSRHNSTPVVLSTGVIKDRKQLKDVIGKFLEQHGLEIIEYHENIALEMTTPNNVIVPSILRQRLKHMGDVVFQVDLETTLRYSLAHEIAATSVIEGDDLKALQKYLEIVSKHFPFGYKSRNFVTALLDLKNSTSIKGINIKNLVEEAESSGVFSSSNYFLGCQGSSKQYRGYPCGLWRLFHFLTVNSEDVNTLKAIKGYVKHFYGCQACSEHFQEMSLRRNMSAVSKADDAILWLWEAHNEVNARLAGDPTEDPQYPKIQFPAKERCPTCVQQDGAWDRNQVLDYLKKMYSEFNIRYLGSDTRALFSDLDN